MGKRLIVAEKPSVGRDIAKVLGCRDRIDGAICGENDIITWAFGHLVSQCYPDEIDEKYKEWNLEDLPIIPEPFQLKVLEGGEKQFQIIKSWMNDPQVDSIVCATDAGREGELIFRYIYQMAECTKPVKRLWISSLTFSAINRGFENLKPGSEYDDLYQSARCRSEADWLIGINGSRAYAVANEMFGLSVGRVLSPTLAILVRRELERRNFVPEEYCELIASFNGFEGKLINSDESEETDKRSRFPTERMDALKLYAAGKPKKAKVIYTETREESIPAQQLYDLTSLQRDANRIFGYSSKHTLDAAQKLYERHKAITYPRTDSRYLSSDIRSTLDKRLESLCTGEWETFARAAMQSEKNLFGRFILNKGVSDHHAIIPTGEAKNIEKWSNAEKQIYDLIVRRFIGMFMMDRVVLKQTVKTVADDKVFLSRGEKDLQEGWATVDTSRRSEMNSLPDLTEGDEISIQNMRVRTDQTNPPAPHTEASLLNAMEHAGRIVEEESIDDHETEFGIGTPATRAATIEKLVEKQMVVRKGRTLIPSEYGIRLIEILPEFLQSPEMTGAWEARLSRISKGSEDPEKFMAGIQNLTKELIRYASNQGNAGIKYASSVGKCPLCGQHVMEYPDSYYCENKECGFRKIWKAVKGFHPTLEPDTMKLLLKERKAVTDKGVYKLIKEEPYIAFERAEKPEPQYEELFALIDEYGMQPVDKTDKGGALWFEGGWKSERMRDFVADCSEIGCFLTFAKSAKALNKKSGWYLQVDSKHMHAYKLAKASNEQEYEAPAPIPPAKPVPVPMAPAPKSEPAEDPVLEAVIQSGFEYVDKRPKGGAFWFIADHDQGKELAKRCAALGVSFTHKKNGGKATGGKSSWYAVW